MNVEQFSHGATGQTATQFVIAQEKIGLLLGTGGKTFKRIGSLFKVHIHLTSGHHQSGEWVSIYGKEDDRARAKEYIMSMCNPMMEEKIPYSADLHEHLVGKGGKTHRYLESNSSAVITFSTACTGPNEHTANIRGSKESVTHATNLVKEIIRKTTKRRQKENQPPGNLKAEDLDKELLHALKAANNLHLWDNIKNQSEEAKRNYLVHLRSMKASQQHSSENSPSSSSEGGMEDGISSPAELLAYAKKLQLPEEDANKVLNSAGAGINKNGFLASVIQIQRKNVERTEPGHSAQPGISGDMFRGYQPEFRSYPGLVSDCAQDFRLEQPTTPFDKQLPLGLSARSIAPMMNYHSRLEQQQQQQQQQQPPTEYSSAPASSHFSSPRYNPDNMLTLDQMLFPTGNPPPPPPAPPSSQHDDEALIIKLLLEQKEKDARERTERQRTERVQEILLRHTQQQQHIQQQLVAQQLKLQLQREQQQFQREQQVQREAHQLSSQLSSDELLSLYKRQQQFYAPSQAGGSQQLPGAPLGPNMHNSAPAAPLGASGGPPLPPATPTNYDMFSAGNLYRTAPSGAGGPPPLENKLSLDFLRDTESTEHVADLIKHLNL